ncbi:MAG: type II toxin-antitoxin system VapC family toxin [Actinomycetota bacterium]
MQVIIDTSCVVGLIDKSCRKHKEISSIVCNDSNEIIIPSPVIPEACYMLNKKFGTEVEIKFIDEIVKANLGVEMLKFQDILRIPEIIKKYLSLDIGFVDAALTAISERVGVNKLLTLDNRHFNTVTPVGFDYFEILV